MEIYFGIISLAYFSFCILLIVGWRKISLVPSDRRINSEISNEIVSVIVVVRNEAQNITKLISDLNVQQYPKSEV